MQTLLNVPLTPLQAALRKLEEGGIVLSEFQKNKKIYRFNPKYPLYDELEQLLKKAYFLLSPLDKNRYFFSHQSKLEIQDESKQEATRRRETKTLFKKLIRTKRLKLRVQDSSATSQSQKEGSARVLVSSDHEREIIFNEEGSWNDLGDSSLFKNSFRWTVDEDYQLITLEHLRYGYEKPVFLFHLTSNQKGKFESLSPHLCNDDTYLGNLQWDKNGVQLNIRIIGPKKNMISSYLYS